MYLKLYNENPNEQSIKQIAEILRNGGVIIYPTDTVYGIGCDIMNTQAVGKVAQLKGINIKKSNFSFICYDLSHISEYTRIDNHVFKLMKRNLPGPFTFILNAASKVPKILQQKKKTIGIRIPDNNIIRDIVKELGNPVLTTSVRDEDDILEYTTDPESIYERYQKLVDLVIDGGLGGNIPSTILDYTDGDLKIIREGKGQLIF